MCWWSSSLRKRELIMESNQLILTRSLLSPFPSSSLLRWKRRKKNIIKNIFDGSFCDPFHWWRIMMFCPIHAFERDFFLWMIWNLLESLSMSLFTFFRLFRCLSWYYLSHNNNIDLHDKKRSSDFYFAGVGDRGRSCVFGFFWRNSALFKFSSWSKLPLAKAVKAQRKSLIKIFVVLVSLYKSSSSLCNQHSLPDNFKFD